MMTPFHSRSVSLILFAALVRLHQASAACSTFVDCVDGELRGSPGTSCRDACFNPVTGNRNCCAHPDGSDCDGFTGRVCADEGQTSCDGYTYGGRGSACKDATIEEVTGCQGSFACARAQANLIDDSCKGDNSCQNMGSFGGSVGNIIGSCNGSSACGVLGTGGFGGVGKVGNVFYSCHGDDSCFALQGCAFYTCPVPNPGIDFLNGSCNGNFACEGLVDVANGGLTCAPNSTPGAVSPDTTPCFDTDSNEVSTCDGSSNVCTSLCPDGEAFIPSNYWVPPLDKPEMSCEHVRLKIPDHGEFTCLPVGQGICRDNGGAFGKWRFGVEEVETPPCEVTSTCRIGTETDTFPVLIDPRNTRYPITGTTFTDSETGEVCKNNVDEAIRGCNYAGTTHICISENIENDPNRYSNERPYMFFYNEKSHQYLYQLVCDGIGEEGKLPELKMVNQESLADAMYVDYPVDIVKFKKGATPNKDDANELWKMYVDWNGFQDPDTRRIGKLASFIGVAHPNLCKEYVSPTDKACWKEDCDDVETSEDYERNDCQI